MNTVSEADFLKSLIDLAHVHGWKVAHFRTGMRADGKYRTPVQGDGAGFPDLLMVRGFRTVFAELKSEKGKLSDEQKEWIYTLTFASEVACDGIIKIREVYVWRPSDWDRIAEILKK